LHVFLLVAILSFSLCFLFAKQSNSETTISHLYVRFINNLYYLNIYSKLLLWAN